MKNKNVENILQGVLLDGMEKIYRENDYINLDNKKDILQTKFREAFNEITELLEMNLGNASYSALSDIEEAFYEVRRDIEKFVEKTEEGRLGEKAVKSILSIKIEKLCSELETLPENLEASNETINTNINITNSMIDDARNTENTEIKANVQYEVEDAVFTVLKTEVKRALYRRNIEDEEIEYEINRIMDSKLVQELLSEFEESDRVTVENILDRKEELITNVKSECSMEFEKQLEEKEEISTEKSISDELREYVYSMEETIENTSGRELEDPEKEKNKEIENALDPNLIV